MVVECVQSSRHEDEDDSCDKQGDPRRVSLSSSSIQYMQSPVRLLIDSKNVVRLSDKWVLFDISASEQ